MSDDLDRLAQESGIELSYISETGEHRVISENVKRALLAAMEISGAEAKSSPSNVSGSMPAARCFVPDWLGRAWGVSLQLYGVTSHRNLGIGDFEDAARLAELFGPLGADFIGINPIHALLLAEPTRSSPYYPSSRQFLNPLYIAVDRIAGAERAMSDLTEADVAALREAQLVDYRRVAAVKRGVLERAFEASADENAFADFREREGAALDRFATFEALSEWFVSQGLSAGWHGWPDPMRDVTSPEVAEFRAASASRIRFHMWLQWIARRQLDDAQARAQAAGMRIGLYLDLAVGVAPDGAAIWCNPGDHAATARIGAPPDLFNHAGQDWGLTPIRPTALKGSGLEPFERDICSAMRSAGAVRIDHAMGLQRLYWIPHGHTATGGGYVRYPFEEMVACVARQSNLHRALVVGEDLGTVAPGFRESMREAGILSYRVLYFERLENGGFIGSKHYPEHAVACLSTHDLPPVGGWWRGRDIATRESLGKYQAGHADAAREDRVCSRHHLLETMRAEQLYGEDASAVLSAGPELDIPADLLIALHRFGARTPCKLFAIQLEDLAGAVEHINLPGTVDEHPNWCRRLPLAIEDLLGSELVRRTIDAVRRERPRSP